MQPPMSTPIATKMLGRYELLFLLGQGGMGEVHLARLTGVGGFEKLCIVKTILPQMQADPQFVDRFHHEARVLVHLTHSNIAQVYDMGDYERTLYMAIEYVPGVDLSRVQSRLSASGNVLPLSMALYIGQQIAEALGYAHRKSGPDGTALGIVHRDVSPQNVMVSYEGEVKVIDFGLAKSAARSKHTMPSTVMGKLGYMSPEQAMARPVDHRSDIFSAGIVIWEMIAGRPLYTGATMGEMVAMMAHPTIPSLREVRPDVSPALERIVMRALATDASDRYMRCDEFARSLNELAVREQLTMGAEDVGNAVRAMCSEEFAAERQLQSKLSLLRKKNQNQSPVPVEEPADGTFLRGGSDKILLTPAQKALSAAAKSSRRPSEPSVVVGRQSLPPEEPESAVSQPNDFDEPLTVSKGRAPLVIVTLLAFGALAGAGYWATTRESASGVVDPVGRAKETTPVKTTPVVDNPKKPDEVVKRPQVVPTGPVYRVARKDGEFLIVLEDSMHLKAGQRLRVVGEQIDGVKRELYGAAGVYKVTDAFAEILIDEDESDLPRELFAFLDTSAPAKLPRKPVKPGETTTTVDKPPTSVAPDPVKPVEPPTTATVRHPTVAPTPVAATSPTTTPATTTPTTPTTPTTTTPTTADPATDWPKRRVILGDVRIDRRRSAASAFGASGEATVSVLSRERDTLSQCTVWLPNGRSSFFRSIQANQNIVLPLDKFKADERPMDKNLRSGGYALVQCSEGSGYFYFTNNNR